MKAIMPVWATDQETIDLTEKAVWSLKDTPVELIIVDNGSTIGGKQLRDWADICMRNRENLGYAKAMNKGFKLLKEGELVLFYQNDVRVSPNWEEVAKEILIDNKVGSVHFRMLPYHQPFNYGNETWKEGKERWSHSACCVVRYVQKFDENYLNSYDDYDYLYRLRQKGYTTAYTNKACFQHLDSFSQQKRTDRGENDKRNYEYYKQKHGEYPDVQFAKMYSEQMSVPWKPFP